MSTSMFNTTCESFQMRYFMTFYLKGYQNYQKSKFKNPKKWRVKVVAVLMPLEMKCHTVPHLKAFTRGIEYRSGHRRANVFRWQKISLKSTHFTS